MVLAGRYPSSLPGQLLRFLVLSVHGLEFRHPARVSCPSTTKHAQPSITRTRRLATAHFALSSEGSRSMACWNETMASGT
eukprot:869263-Rhodomonas_salina.1